MIEAFNPIHATQNTVGSGPGATDPAVQYEMLSMTYDGAVMPERAETAAALERSVSMDGRNLEGLEVLTNSTHIRGHRRLQPIMGVNFAGISNLQGYAPPDTVGAVGPNHYVQMVNVLFAIYSKTGQTLVSPRPIQTLFEGSGTHCTNRNDGDPIVLYDKWADRWVLSQFTTVSSQVIMGIPVCTRRTKKNLRRYPRNNLHVN